MPVALTLNAVASDMSGTPSLAATRGAMSLPVADAASTKPVKPLCIFAEIVAETASGLLCVKPACSTTMTASAPCAPSAAAWRAMPATPKMIAWT